MLAHAFIAFPNSLVSQEKCIEEIRNALSASLFLTMLNNLFPTLTMENAPVLCVHALTS